MGTPGGRATRVSLAVRELPMATPVGDGRRRAVNTQLGEVVKDTRASVNAERGLSQWARR